MAEALPALPGPALEAVLLAVVKQWINEGHQGPDPRLHTLPLVCKEWKRCLEAVPGVWDEVIITKCAKILKGYSSVEADRAERWFERGPAARSLTIDCPPGLQYSFCERHLSQLLCFKGLKSILRVVQPRLQRLSIRYDRGVAGPAVLWQRFLKDVEKDSVKVWPCLEELKMELDTPRGYFTGTLSPSYITATMLRSLHRPPVLRKATIILHGIHITSLPQELAQATQLKELQIRFCACKGAGAHGQPLLLPARRSTLPLPPNLKFLKFINSPFIDANVLATAQAQCPRLRHLSLTRDT